MSNAAVADAVPPKQGKKKLIIIIATVAVLLVGGSGAAVMLMKKKAANAEAAAAGADADEDGDAGNKPAKSAKHDPKAMPTFVPLDPFTVNLADRENDHYAQVGITLEVGDQQTADQLKAFMPAVRNNILLALGDRTSAELAGREGKRVLAERLRREVSKALGVQIEDEEAPASEEEVDAKPAKKGKKKKKTAPPELPITAVHFSNFIIQ